MQSNVTTGLIAISHFLSTSELSSNVPDGSNWPWHIFLFAVIAAIYMRSADHVMKSINHLIDISRQNFSFLFIYSNIFLYFKLITLSPFTTCRCWFTQFKNVFRGNRADLRTCYFMLKDVIRQSIQLVCKQPTTTHSTTHKEIPCSTDLLWN